MLTTAIAITVAATVCFWVAAKPAGSESAASRAREGTAGSAKENHAATESTTPGAGSQAHAGNVSTPTTTANRESAAAHAAEKTSGSAKDTHAELKPLGINIEAVPFVTIAALTSLALALGAWLRPQWLLLLLLLVATMLVFGALDVREVFHQHDESNTGLAVLAGVIAGLHFAAAGVAALMARSARHPPAPAAEMAA